MRVEDFDIEVHVTHKTATAKVKRCPDCRSPVGPVEEPFGDARTVVAQLMIRYEQHRRHCCV